jgi:hypothetical protein
VACIAFNEFSRVLDAVSLTCVFLLSFVSLLKKKYNSFCENSTKHLTKNKEKPKSFPLELFTNDTVIFPAFHSLKKYMSHQLNEIKKRKFQGTFESKSETG